jgi:hypothetical protein
LLETRAHARENFFCWNRLYESRIEISASALDFREPSPIRIRIYRSVQFLQ